MIGFLITPRLVRINLPREGHLMLGHILCGLIEKALFGNFEG
jgi:hypothetical protein